MKNGETASGTEYRIDKQFRNLPIFRILKVFEIEKILKICSFPKLFNSGNLLIFQS